MGKAPCSCGGSPREGSPGFAGPVIPFGGIASRSPVGAVYDGQRQSYASWCLNGQLERRIQRGEMTREEAIKQLEAMPRGGSVYAGSRQDFSTKDCSFSSQDRISEATDFILNNIGDLPNTCTPNTTNYCLSGGNGLCYGGHAFATPRRLVEAFIGSPNFKIHCDWFCLFNPIAYAICGQWNDKTKDIYICSRKVKNLGRKKLACVIAYQIMHVFGADENAATAMVDRTVGWGCP